MKEFINEFGRENFIIIIAVVGVILLALLVIVIIEKLQSKSRIKEQLKREIEYLDKAKNDQVQKDTNITNNQQNNTNYQNNISVQPEVTTNDEFSNNQLVNNEPVYNEPERVEVLEDASKENEVVYVEDNNVQEEAKEKLEEVTKKLIDEPNDLIDHTHFETEQEEKSIISYDELVQASHDINEKNDKVLEDEGDAAITLEELYQKHVEKQNVIDEDNKDVKVNNPIFEDNSPKRFKNSEVISPVFGFYSGEVKKEKTGDEVLEDLNRPIKPKDLEDEIKKTEDFLSELKRLKNKLE